MVSEKCRWTALELVLELVLELGAEGLVDFAMLKAPRLMFTDFVTLL